jgi:CRISPR-associated protein Cmr2
MSLTAFRHDPGYWDRKLAHYLHDPPDKALAIPGHAERAKELRKLGHLPDPDEGLWQRADVVAAGLDRAWLPGYDPDPRHSGAVDFRLAPKLTHPVSEVPALEISGPLAESREIFPLLKRKLDEALKPLEQAFSGQPIQMAPARFHLVHHALREILARDPEAKLGGLWYRLPADTRIPDHSIWQHCALVSALASCYADSREKRASLLVFSITPVQDFLLRARKLRDYWTGSLILSWLAFEGLRQVIYFLGSDHVLYPSPIGQPLVNRLLRQECAIPREWLKPQPEDFGGVASLPNKFVCLVPGGREEEVAEKVTRGILEAWQKLGEATLHQVENITRKSDAYLRDQFRRQFEHSWDLRWAAGPLLEEGHQVLLPELLPESVWQSATTFRQAAQSLKVGGPGRGEEGYYGPSHALVQGFLAAGKTHREDKRPPEPGIKCDLHGDLEILRYSWNGGDRNPRPGRDPFWAPTDADPQTKASFKAKWQPVSDFKDSERLSAVGLAKRLAYRVTQRDAGHPLKPYFDEGERFPSTTEVALGDWLDRVGQKLKPWEKLGKDWRRDLANFLHDQEPEVTPGEREAADQTEETRRICQELVKAMDNLRDPPRAEDRYLAILTMDGDRLGRLMSGESLRAVWKSVIHPDLQARLASPAFASDYREFWQEKNFLSHPRLLAPQVHAAISEALADFSLHSVPEIIRKHRGRLIYAGGDDVCAVLPVSRAMNAAREISRCYRQAFLFQDDSAALPQEVGPGSWQPRPGRLLLHLGQDHTISGGILICHHKKPLAAAMRRAQELLKEAKDYGRNALAVELDRRGGAPRRFFCQWDEKPWEDLNLPDKLGQRPLPDLFLELAAILGDPDNLELSSSLLYSLEELRPGLEALATAAPEKLVPFVAKQVWRTRRAEREESEEKKLTRQYYAGLVAALAVRPPGKKKPDCEEKRKELIQPEGLIVARFVGLLRQRARVGQEVAHA